MELLRGLQILAFFSCFYWLPDLAANTAAPSLNVLLQHYAYRAFVRPRTGISYDVTLPANLTGIKIGAMRLRNGSFRKRGVPAFKEFAIPSGVIVTPYVKRLVLVYQDLGNFSQAYYPLPGFDYVAPVLGLLAYDATDLSATSLPELDIRASGDPIRIVFSGVRPIREGSSARCVSFDLRGLVIFSNVVESGNTCAAVEQGHFSLVEKSIVPPPAAAPPGGKANKSNSDTWTIVGSIIGGALLVGLLAFLALSGLLKRKRKRKMQEMERAREAAEALRMTLVGNTRAPSAAGTRTPPMLETECVA